MPSSQNVSFVGSSGILRPCDIWRWHTSGSKEDRSNYRMAKADNSTEVRNFLGLAGYYKRFVKDFSKIALPLTRLTQKNVKFVWADRCEEHFQLLKDLLTSAPVLTLPSGDKGFTVYYDASRVGLRCMLMQNKRVVAYASRQLKKHE